MSSKIVFMGTPEFSIPSLENLINNKLNVIKVYTQPPKKSKRGQKVNPSPIEKFCKKRGIDFRSPSVLDNPLELKIFKKLSPDIVIVVAYGKIIPKNFLKLPKFGFINIHASLLPKWRGAAPIQRSIMNEDKKTGVCIMKIEEKLDSGPVLFSDELKLDRNLTYGEVEKKLSEMGAKLLIKSMKKIRNKDLAFEKQDDSQATYAKKIDKNETKIKWNLSANKIIAHINGLSPKPGAWFQYQNERYKILRAKISTKKGKPGFVLDENLTIGCKLNSIQILEIQRQGKNKQLISEFLLGNKIDKGTILL